jgi:histidine ammonia-lyase
LVSENKSLAWPASVDTVPTSAGQEDHVSMATHAARKAATIADNAAGVIGIELLAAVQGIDFHAPLTTSPQLGKAVERVRAAVPHLAQDRYLADEIAWAKGTVLAGDVGREVAGTLFG